ncbi:MAG: sigma-70 family RNA polymerase sigma factor [Rhodopirellula sp.]|nr:sigma-70 family RNA polymerase sigma factor [Rhodopirellula sp.]
MDETSLDDVFMDLLSRHQGQLFGYIFAAVRNLDDAEELYQQTCLILWRKFADYRPQSDFARWASKVAKFEILHFQRSRRRSPIVFNEKILANLAEAQPSREDPSLRAHEEILAECVNELPSGDQRLVRLCYGTQRSIKQVAGQLNYSTQTVYNSLSRIRRALYDCIQSKQDLEREP